MKLFKRKLRFLFFLYQQIPFSHKNIKKVFTKMQRLSGAGEPGSNRRHSAWKADALPTELLPLVKRWQI